MEAPGKISPENTAPFVDGSIDYSNSNMDSFLSELNAHKVWNLDMRKTLLALSTPYEDFFFRTDHHWKTETAFLCYQTIINELSTRTDMSFDPLCLDADNFVFDTYKGMLLGSQGRRVGEAYSGVDDYTLITPNFSTAYKLTAIDPEGNTLIREGDFRSSILTGVINTDKGAYSISYAQYISPDYPIIEIENLLQENGRILVIQDSFGSPVSAFLSLQVRNLVVIDLRGYNNIGTLCKYLDTEMSFDAVVIIYNPGALGNASLFSFGL